MPSPEIEQLELLASVDELVDALTRWSAENSDWRPMGHCRALVQRLLGRLESLRIRLEAPLIVATFGGTGTGKSALVNALIGQESTPSGRQRPTTTRPILLAHNETDLEPLEIPLEDFEVVRSDASLLRDIVIVDCPDPDTSEGASHGSNLERLRQLLPICDVLLYVSTQQKYRSARVIDELAQAAAGCRIVFVQTHADTDTDIRDDWREHLAEQYDVPEMFFVDSIRALNEQKQGHRASGDLARLQSFLTTQLSASRRLQIRRANLIDLIEEALQHCHDHFSENWPEIEELEEELQRQQVHLTHAMSDRLRKELLLSQNLWERRLLGSVTQIWGFSPFSSVLRFYNGLGSFIASMTLFRARNSAQMALIGALQGAKWLKNRRTEREAEENLQQISHLGLSDSVIRESQFVVNGYAKSARFDADLVDEESFESLRDEAVRVEERFLGDAARQIDEIIDDLATANSGWGTRLSYEIAFLVYVIFVLFRVGKNFFYDSFIGDEPLMPVDFFISAGVFFILWTGLLVMLFTRKLRSGLQSRIEAMADNLARQRISHGLFPHLETALRQVLRLRASLESMLGKAESLRRNLASSSALGGRGDAAESGRKQLAEPARFRDPQ